MSDWCWRRERSSRRVIELYRSVGYELTESYGQYRDYPDSRCFTKTLR